jgi:hypothetical protein
VPLYKLANLYPLLGHGLGKVSIGGLYRGSAFGEVLALAVVGNSLQGLGNVKKSGVRAVILSTLIIFATTLAYNLVMPYYTAAENTNPIYILARSISYGRFFQRFESIYLFAWSISSIFAAGISLYMTLSIYCKIFRLDDHRTLVLPLAILLFSTAILPPDISTIALNYVPFSRKYFYLIYFGIPLLALLVALVRGKKGEPSGA